MSAEHSPEINGIGKALCALQAQLTPVGKNAAGHNYKYSDLPTLLDHVKPLMAAWSSHTRRPARSYPTAIRH